MEELQQWACCKVFCDRKGIRGSVNVLCLGAQIYNEQVGQWLFSHFCKQRNILERLSLLSCSGFCKIISGASPCLSLGVGQ